MVTSGNPRPSLIQLFAELVQSLDWSRICHEDSPFPSDQTPLHSRNMDKLGRWGFGHFTKNPPCFLIVPS